MARNFRPVRELWGEASSCFVEDMLRVLEWIAEFGDCGTVETASYSDNVSIWIEKGGRFLNTVSAYNYRTALIWEFPEEDPSAIEAVCSNLRNLASEWRASLNPNGSLTFYVDAW